MEVDFGTGFKMERGIRENPLFRSPLSGNFSREDASAIRVEDKEGLTRRVGFDPHGSLDMVSPSNLIIRGKGLIFEGICKIPGVENMEVCLPFPQPPKSSSIPSYSLELPLPSPSGLDLPSSISHSQSPMENQVISKIFSKKDVGTFYQKYVGIPVHDEEVNQFALSNQLSESFTPRKSKPNSPKEDSNLLTGSLLMACPLGKWLKCERFYALWILRFIPGGRTVAPQVIETWWIWFGGLGSMSFSMKIIN